MKTTTKIPKVKQSDITEHIEIIAESREAIKNGFTVTLEEFMNEAELKHSEE